MISQFSKAISSGFTPEQILEYLMKKSPEHVKKISHALGLGFTPAQVLNYLTKSKPSERAALTEYEETRNADISKREKATKYGSAAALAGIAGAGLAALPARGISQAIARNAIPSIAQSGLDQNPETRQTQAPTSASSLPPDLTTPDKRNPSQPPVSPNITQPTPPPQPEVKSIDVGEILNKHGLQQRVDELIAKKANPSIIVGNLFSKMPKEVKEFQKESGMKLEDAIADYLAQNPSPKPTESQEEMEAEEATIRAPAAAAFNVGPPKIPAVGPEGPASIPSPGPETIPDIGPIGPSGPEPIPSVGPGLLVGQTPAMEKEKKPAQTKKKGALAISPEGVGEIKGISGNNALIEVNGKVHQVDENDLIESPIPEKDLADLYDDLIAGIEKASGKQVSRNVEWAGYDPKTNELAYKPHGSDKLYVYDDISTDDVELLTSLMTQRKSTGQNFIGAWQAGTESPIGAAMYQLIKKLQSERGGKGNEYKNKYDTIYDALEIAKTAAKKKHAERKKKAQKPRLD